MTMEREPTTAHLDDEVLSGLLDGEVAPDGGVHLAACATCRARRDELAAARAVLRNDPAPEIDELTRRRLIAAALAEVPAADAGGGRERPWFQRRAVAGGVAAALLALLAAVPFVTGGDDRATDEAATADAGTGTLQAEAATGTFLGDLGELSPSTLRDRLGLAPLAGGAGAGEPDSASASRSSDQSAGVAAVAGSAADDATTTPPQVPEALSSPAPYGGDPASEAAKAASGAGAAAEALDRAASDACVASLVAGPAAGKPLIALGVGAYQGVPAVVAAFDTGSGSEVFVTARNDCRILTHLIL